MFNRRPETGWVMFHEVMETKKRFIRDLTVIDPDWLPERQLLSLSVSLARLSFRTEII